VVKKPVDKQVPPVTKAPQLVTALELVSMLPKLSQTELVIPKQVNVQLQKLVAPTKTVLSLLVRQEVAFATKATNVLEASAPAHLLM